MPSIRRNIVIVLSVWQAAAGFASALTSVSGTPFPSLIDVTINNLQEGLRSNLFSSVDLVNAYPARIQDVKGMLHAVTEANPDALHIARELDSLRDNGTNLGPTPWCSHLDQEQHRHQGQDGQLGWVLGSAGCQGSGRQFLK
ncbi:hypothetical protein DL771_004999 [Monosporascus sp. 5C6A]|nr:hypothetical protein DL771_004999 [Monosporascus sp. 5C6A]